MRHPSNPRATSIRDVVRTLALARPWGAASHEIARLVGLGCVAGSTCELAFSIQVADAAAGVAAAMELRLSGDEIARGPSLHGVLTVHRAVRLRALDLARELVRLERRVALQGGWVAIVGPATPNDREARLLAELLTEDGALDEAPRAA